MKSGRADEHTLERMDRYVQRIEQYVEAMSSIQRLEQLRVRPCEMTGSVLREELEETARLLAPGTDIRLSVTDLGTIRIDHGIFLTVAENLIGNAARFAHEKLEESPEHLGMGLYGSSLLCLKHGGELQMKNLPAGGAEVTAFFVLQKTCSEKKIEKS